MMRRLLLIALFPLPLSLPLLVGAQATGVVAEALGQANMRADAAIDAPIVGEISSGTRYPVVGRSEFFPWLLLGDPQSEQALGWVFRDLLSVQGDLSRVPFSTMSIQPGSAPPTSAPTVIVDATLPPLSGVVIPTTPTPLPASNISGLVSGEINIRFGPGVEYPRIGVANDGERYEITAYHTQFPWLQIRYPGAPNGFGWIAADLLEVQGNVFTLPAISQTSFILPTLTPTPPAVIASNLVSNGPISPAFQALGDGLFNMALAEGFEPETSRKAALFLMDLQTGEALTFGDDLAFSGMSLTKIPILTDLYSQLDRPPDSGQALNIAQTMICSENTSSNRLLGLIGGGDTLGGAQHVSSFMQDLGLGSTFLAAPFLIDPNAPATPLPVRAPQTSADQISTNPDPFNQATVEELGALLGGVYQCAAERRNLLDDAFSDSYTATECNQMLHIMSNNQIGELIEAGVPPGTTVAHKHGWIEDTHGDAGVVFTPGGDYVLVMALYSPDFLDFQISFPLMAEMSRAVYNYYNPDAPFEAINRQPVPESCELLGSPLITDLMSFNFTFAP